MKGLLIKNMIVARKSILLLFAVELMLCIGMEFMFCFVIETNDAVTSGMTIEQAKIFFGSFAATLGLMFIFIVGINGRTATYGKVEGDFDTLMHTLPVSAKDVVIAHYVSTLTQRLIGIIAAVIYFTAGYLMGLFSSPLKYYWKIGIIVFFAGWLSAMVLMPLSLNKSKAFLATLAEGILMILPFVYLMIGDTIEKITDLQIWFSDNSNIVLLCVAVLAVACTPISMHISKSCMRKERIC